MVNEIGVQIRNDCSELSLLHTMSGMHSRSDHTVDSRFESVMNECL
jgi:hypothetical protein